MDVDDTPIVFDPNNLDQSKMIPGDKFNSAMMLQSALSNSKKKMENASSDKS